MARQRSQLLSDGFHVHTAVTAEERQERIANLRRRGLTPRQLLTAYLHSEQALLDHPPGFSRTATMCSARCWAWAARAPLR